MRTTQYRVLQAQALIDDDRRAQMEAERVQKRTRLLLCQTGVRTNGGLKEQG